MTTFVLVYVSFVKSISSLVVTGAHETERIPLLSTEYDEDARLPVQTGKGNEYNKKSSYDDTRAHVQHPRQ